MRRRWQQHGWGWHMWVLTKLGLNMEGKWKGDICLPPLACSDGDCFDYLTSPITAHHAGFWLIPFSSSV
jgi:hypothetical protein